MKKLWSTYPPFPLPSEKICCFNAEGRGAWFIFQTTSIIRKQRINPKKLTRAKELRQKMTPSEEILWEHLRNNSLNGIHFRRQQVLYGYIADFYCHSARLVIEVDGGVHESRKDEDEERDNILKTKGLKICRIANADIRTNLQEVLKQIEDLII